MTSILKIELNNIVQELIAKHDALGMRASGKWAKGLTVEASQYKGVLWGESYTQQLATGRKPGRFPPIKSIEQWIRDKNISLQNNIKISTLAFLIARKIANEGTKYFQQGGTDLIESIITPQRIQSIIDKVSDFQVSEFTTDLVSAFQKIAA